MRMKRMPAFVLLLLLALTLTLGMQPLTARADEDVCSHSWVFVGWEATCTEDGLDYWQCEKCYIDRAEPVNIPALGHHWTAWTTEGEDQNAVLYHPATCTEAGYEGRYCTNCYIRENRTIPATGHSWDSGTVTAAPTCTAEGTKTFTCTSCGATRTESVPATGHSPVTTPDRAATCTEDGLTDGSACSVCGTVLTASQTIPATGHRWGEWVVDVPSTCQKAGLEYMTCQNCGEQQWRYAELAEHDWDEGTVTKEPGYLEEGVITHTCRTCGETWTETAPLKEVPGGYPGIMSMLRKDPTDGEGPTLAIVVQPAGGVLKDGFTLSVEAAGGTEPYTYEWYRLNGRESMTGAAAEKELDHLGFRATDRYEKALTAAGRLAKLHPGNREIPAGVAPEATLSAKAFSSRVGDNSPEYTPDQPGTYYCVVTDDAENAVTSIRARVSVPLYISEQPKNANKHGNDAAYLYCAAAGGEPAEDGTYTYSWFLNGDEPVFLTKNTTGRAQVFEEGDYFCVVRDSAGGRQTSLLSRVYDTKLLTVKVENDFMPFIPDSPSAPFRLTVSGGIPPYECACTFDGVTETKTIDGTNVCDWDSSRFGEYTFTVKDSMGETAYATAKVDYLPLLFALQPEDGKLPADGSGFDLQVTISDFEEYPPAAPFTWTLYRDGEAYKEGISETREITVNTGDPGMFTFHIEDSGGRKGDTSVATVEDSEIRIVRIDVDGEWKRNGDTVELMVITEGNIALAYRWYWLGTEKAVDAPVVGEEVICEAERPGEYMVRVEDVNHKFAWGYCTVPYTGAEPLAPFIIEQPEDWEWLHEDDEGAEYKVTLHCKATGGHLLYNWMKEDGDWLPIGGGETLELTGPQWELRGRYYCIVYDFDTGKETRSETVCVQLKPSCEINGLENNKLIWSVRGGFPPWKVKIYFGPYLEAWDTCNYSNNTKHRTEVEPYGRILNYDNEQKRWVETKFEKHFHLVVTDRYGQTFESDVY